MFPARCGCQGPLCRASDETEMQQPAWKEQGPFSCICLLIYFYNGSESDGTNNNADTEKHFEISHYSFCQCKVSFPLRSLESWLLPPAFAFCLHVFMCVQQIKPMQSVTGCLAYNQPSHLIATRNEVRKQLSHNVLLLSQ